MDMANLVAEINAQQIPIKLARDERVQFGLPEYPFIGAELLPEVFKLENQFEETDINYKTFVANSATRYSPPQMKGTSYVGSADIKLGEQDIAAQLTGKDYDNLLKTLVGGNKASVRQQIIDFMQSAVNLALVVKNEAMRWEAIVNATGILSFMDGRSETVSLSNPVGHRVIVPSGTIASPTGWHLSTYDPFTDIFAIQRLLASKGYVIRRIITSTYVLSTLGLNGEVKRRTGFLPVGNGATLQAGNASIEAINAQLKNFNLPPIEVNDQVYHTQTQSPRFIDETAFIFICTTGRSATFLQQNGQTQTIPNVLGYHGVGIATGEVTPGRVVKLWYEDKKPVGVYCAGWQTSFPVIKQPEAIAVIKIPRPTP